MVGSSIIELLGLGENLTKRNRMKMHQKWKVEEEIKYGGAW